MTIKTNTVQTIEVSEWDKAVKKTYKRPYSFQQQENCQPRGVVKFTVPAKADDYPNDTVPEEINHPNMGVSFVAWLTRDPKQPLPKEKDQWAIDMWWERNFYPNLQMVANDLHKKGLLKAGDYTIIIDW